MSFSLWLVLGAIGAAALAQIVFAATARLRLAAALALGAAALSVGAAVVLLRGADQATGFFAFGAIVSLSFLAGGVLWGPASGGRLTRPIAVRGLAPIGAALGASIIAIWAIAAAPEAGVQAAAIATTDASAFPAPAPQAYIAQRGGPILVLILIGLAFGVTNLLGHGEKASRNARPTSARK